MSEEPSFQTHVSSELNPCQLTVREKMEVVFMGGVGPCPDNDFEYLDLFEQIH